MGIVLIIIAAVASTLFTYVICKLFDKMLYEEIMGKKVKIPWWKINLKKLDFID